MRKKSNSLRPVGLFLFFCSVFALIMAQFLDPKTQEVNLLEWSSESLSFPYGKLDSVKKRFVLDNSPTSSIQSFDGKTLDQIISVFNQSQVPSGQDPIDQLLGLLPKSYRQHFSLIHRSFSIQKSTPLSPRVILYGPDAKLMMTFNSHKDETGRFMDGGDSLELIEWIPEERIWQFSEITFDKNNKARRELDPAKCVMCHAGTPKPIDYSDVSIYKKLLKPIFPQYPFWPGFYGSVNDVVGIDEPKSQDTIMRNLDDTIKQIKDLTFDSTEELYRLRELLDRPNSKYIDVVKNELEVHLRNFKPFIESIPSRDRYRHLVLMTDSYKNKKEKIPEALRSAPFRRTFDKEYGHYLLRPNFYLSSLLTSYHAQFVAEQISSTKIFQQIKFSLLYKKFNCGDVVVNGLSTKDLNESFDLIYPNQSSEESRRKQFLLSYQYNVVQSQKGGFPHLPLHAWNLEGNEEIASYHYGNVYADLNELVLWNLLTIAFPDVKIESGRDAAEKRHYELIGSDYFQKPLNFAKSYVSRMTQDQMNMVSKFRPYSDTNKQFKAMPVSVYCNGLPVYDSNKKLIGYKNSLKQSVEKELEILAELKESNQLPHQLFKLDPRFYKEDEITKQKTYRIELVRQACESCHLNNLGDDKKINPAINVNWSDQQYTNSLKQIYVPIESDKSKNDNLYFHIKSVLNKDALPVPYGQSMPYGRRPMDEFSLKCENFIIDRQYSASKTLGYVDIFECGVKYPNADKNSLGCQCFQLANAKHNLHLEMYRIPKKK